MIRLVLLFILTTALLLPLSAQQMEMGDINIKIDDILASMPGEGDNDYVPPGNMQQLDWEFMLSQLFAANYAGAATDAAALGYDLIEFSDLVTDDTYYVLQTSDGSTNYWGTYVYHPNACRSELIIQAPHPKKDFNTGRQGIYIFSAIDALFYMVAGTNRCNTIATSSCDGQTSICSDTDTDEDYRISDLAHVVDAIWQVTTAHIHDNLPGTYFAQLHGFTKGNDDPFVIMSNGTRQTPNPDPLTALSSQLLIIDPALSSEIAHINQDWDKLIGFTNTQGRYINSSLNICNANATTTNGRFMHLEQEKSQLRADINGWHKMAQALSMTFSPGFCGILDDLLPLEWTQFEVHSEGPSVLINWATAWEQDNAHFEVQRKGVNGLFKTIQLIPAKGDTQDGHSYRTTDNLQLAGTYYYRLKQVDLDGQYTYSLIRAVQVQTSSSPKVWTQAQQLEVRFLEGSEKKLSLELYNAIGQACGTWSDLSSSIDISYLPKGIYFYKIGYEGQVWSGKFLSN
ncbi:MAG: T9SS type A sorting domain-containing protein [Bacteroidota bacterium]